MIALLLAPHHDDETLFASFLCLKYKPRVVVCTTPKVQERWGVQAKEREEETDAVMKLYGCEWRQLSLLDTEDSIFEGVRQFLLNDRYITGEPSVVIAPAWEKHGHQQHNDVAIAAREVYRDRLITYLAYANGDRSRHGIVNEPDDPAWIGLKLQALACYRSQLRVPNCRPWFYNLLDVREWIADEES